MSSHNLLEPHGLHEQTVMIGQREENASQISGNSVLQAHAPAGDEARRQRHITEVLWILLGMVIVLGGALLWAEFHGLFESAANPAKSSAPWPVGWP